MTAQEELDQRTDAEVAARVRAFDLIQAVQTSDSEAPARVKALTEEADRRGWTEVGLICRFASAAGARFRKVPPPALLLEEMTWVAEGSADVGVHALLAAYRAWVGDGPGAAANPDQDQALLADTQLAQAVVLLERREGAVLSRIAAHTMCAISFSRRDLWELELDQYRAIGTIDMFCEEPELRFDPGLPGRSRWASIYNIVEVELRRALALRTVGEPVGQRERAQATLERYRAAVDARLPAHWLEELRSCELLARALLGDPGTLAAAEAAAGPGATPEGRGTALTAAAACLAHSDPAAARVVAERAVDILQGVPEAIALGLALRVAAEAEGSEAGLRLARELTAKLSFARTIRLNAMEALLRSERFRIRSEELDRHAHLDPLTGLANRRAFKRYLDDLLSADIERVALVLVDIDRFKSVNDNFGHQAGDEALQRLGSVLRALVRPGDLAARLGGDEFLLLLRGTGPQVAAERAASVMSALAQSRRSSVDQPAPFTVSVGVASGAPSALDQLMAEADRALYEAKATGGDRWVAAAGDASRV